MRIHIKTLTGVKWTFEVEPSDTIENVKARFEDTGFRVDQQRLFFDDKQLEDWQLLSEFGIGHNATVHLAIVPPAQVANNVGDITEIVTFLRALGLRPKTLQTLISNEITVQNFKFLTEPDIKELFPLVGERLDVRQAVRRANERDTIALRNIPEPGRVNNAAAVAANKVSVNVKWRDGRDFVSGVVLDSSASVGDLKEKLSHDIHPDMMRLLYFARQLEDGRTLSDYNIRNEDVLMLILRIRGC